MNHINVGKIGEDIACKFLIRKGYHVIDRNFRKKYGEIDIVAGKEDKIYLCEVKTFSGRNSTGLKPEDNVTDFKRQKLARVAEVYMSRFEKMPEFFFVVICVSLDLDKKTAHIRILNDVLPG